MTTIYNKRLNIRIDQETENKLEKLCAAASLGSNTRTRSKVIRDAILHTKIIHIKGQNDMIQQLKKIGNNLNQIAIKLNANKEYDQSDLLKIESDLSDINTKLDRALQKLYTIK